MRMDVVCGRARACPWALAVFTTLLAAPPPPALAWVCTIATAGGPNLAWAARSVTLSRSGVGDELDDPGLIDAALANASAAWTEVGCSDVALVLGPPTADRLVGFDWAAGSGMPQNKNILVFRNGDDDDPVDAWVHQLGALAITTVTFESNAGRLLDADIEMNDAQFRFSACDRCDVDFDLENTLTHELGHVLGLDHSADVEATMFASAPRGDVSKRTLHEDDVEGVCTVYPAGRPTGLCPGAGPRASPPDVRFSASGCSSGVQASSSAPVALAAVLAVIHQRRRCRRPEMACSARRPNPLTST